MTYQMKMEDKPQVAELEFLWLPKRDELNSILNKENKGNFKLSGPVLKFKQSLSRYCGFPIYVTDCIPRNEFDKTIKNMSNETEDNKGTKFLYTFFNINCTMKLEKDLQHDYRRFINFFCSSNLGKLTSEVWLLLNTSIFKDYRITTSDETLELAKFSLGNLSGLNTFTEHFDSKTSLQNYDMKITQTKLKFLHDYKKLVLFFAVGKKLPVKKRNSCTHRFQKLEIQYGSLHSVVISKTDVLSVYLRMFEPPLMYSVYQANDESEDYIEYSEIQSKTSWLRIVDLFEGSNSVLKKEFSMNMVLKIDFIKGDEYDFLFQLLIHCKTIQIFFAPMTVIPNYTDHLNKSIMLDNFDCFYAVQCLLTYSFEIMDQLVIRGELEEFKAFLQDESKENPAVVCEALYIIYDTCTRGNIVMFHQCLKYLYKKLLDESPKPTSKDDITNNKNKSHLLYIKRVVATPTHFRLLPPQPTLKSRALRDCDPDFSLRISIKDVNFRTINFTVNQGFFPDLPKYETDFYCNYFKNNLLQGIKIGKRVYKYIGNSTSQLKAHGMWFYAKDEQNLTAADLRKQFGALEKIKKVSKYMARMGQTFSQSMGNIRVPQEWTNVKDPEEDIKEGRKKYLVLTNKKSEEAPKKFLVEKKDSDDEDKDNKESGDEVEEEAEPYVFSDGIGRMSQELAEEVYKTFKVEENRPSAMQIRYAGCKGMLVVDPKLKGKQIVFRKSMKKFESDDDSLEILKFSEKRSAFLNRPFITILEQLGIPKKAFIELQKDMIQNHITSMFDENAACEFLNRNSLLRINFLKLYLANVHFTEDPLFRSMIHSLFQKQIELLKSKANIEIPVTHGRTFFGVLDETRTLEYGQVFIQYSDWKTNKPKILEETVVVTKNPCMHPGDVRIFEAVDVEDLHHIVDCIVFPAKGPRPHPDEMAGSDLDGDEYHAMWLKSLMFSENHEPMHFARKDNNEELNRPVRESDELDHFGNYIFNDDVGLIASAHLVHADDQKQGIFSEVCISLAKKYSISLDFAKSGNSIKIGRDRAFKYPDFMEKLDSKITYLSKKALGDLFRNCKKLELGLDTERLEIDYVLDVELNHENWENKYKPSSLRMLKQYSKRIETLLRNFGFENEGQLLSGALINPPKHYENRHDMQNLMALLEYEIQWIFRDLERRFFSEFGGKPQDGIFTDEMHQKASAWYMVSYTKSEKVSSYFGLPWAVVDVLADLKIKNKKDVNITNVKTILENVVDESISKYMKPKLTPETSSLIIYENRFSMLDLAYKVLTKWIKMQREYFTDFNFKRIEKNFGAEFKKLTDKITTCDVSYIENLKRNSNIKKAISPCYYIIKTILNIAKIGVYTSDPSDALQELGLLSWITLIKLSCTYNPQYLGIPNACGEYAETVLYQAQDNVIDTIQLPLNDCKILYNRDFTKKLLTDGSAVRVYLLKATKLKDIEFRNIFGRDGSEYVRLTVRGTRYSIEKLKDIAVLDNFYECVVKNELPY